MKKQKVIKFSNLPKSLPTIQTAIAYLLLDKFSPPQFIWGAICLFYLFVWIIYLVIVFNQQQQDIFKDDTTI
jgi:hypothetical protein